MASNLAANMATCSHLLKEAASAGAKLLCFPEAFSYVGTMDGDSVLVAEPLDGPIMNHYCSLARFYSFFFLPFFYSPLLLHNTIHFRESDIWLSLGGFQEIGSDPQHLCNTHVIVDDTGKIISSYRKIHLQDH
ncbi:hypothetical protein GLYMA_20G243133v4 [Glycine max]|nr:hypothetical protein GLYMA_20G243133v4 [Glycine max]